MANYVVMRCPEEPSLDGKWFDTEHPVNHPWPAGYPWGEFRFVSTGEFEVREDGAIAQVYRQEVQDADR